MSYAQIAHTFNEGNDEEINDVNCFMSSAKTPEQWQEDGLKCKPSGYVITMETVKAKTTEMGGELQTGLNRMRM